MVGKEFQKIWNLRSCLLILVVGAALLYSWVAGQMQLRYLPLFETVELETCARLQEIYGNELDDLELEELRALYENEKQKLDQSILQAHPEIVDMGYSGYEDFLNMLSDYDVDEVEDEAEKESIQRAWDLYQQIGDEFAWKIETCNTYAALLERKNFSSWHMVWSEDNKEIMNRIREIESRDTVSVLPDQVTMNMEYVMEAYSRITMYLILLLILPYLAMDNRRRVHSIVAATKTGRRLVIHQMKAMLLSVLLLLGVWNVLFYIVYRVMTPYEVYDQCLVPELWFDWTWPQYFWIRIGMLDAGAAAFAMVIFYLSSRCRTIVGTVAVALPCWAAGEFFSLHFFGSVFALPEWKSISYYLAGCGKYLPFVVVFVMLLAGGMLLFRLYYERRVKDIME